MADVWSGITVIVTRPRAQADRLVALLTARGATVQVEPVIDVVLMPERLQSRLSEIRTFAGIVLTSANAARALRAAIAVLGLSASDIPPCAPVGRVTARVVRAAGWDVWPGTEETGSGEALARMLASLPPRRWWFPCGDQALDTVPAILSAAGHEVVRDVCYETRPVQLDGARWSAWFASPAVFFTWFSPSAVHACAAQCKPLGPREMQARHACIGATTARACEAQGWPVACVAAAPTEEALLEAMAGVLKTQAQR